MLPAWSRWTCSTWAENDPIVPWCSIDFPAMGRHESSAEELSPSCSSMTSTTRSRKSDSFILGEPRTSTTVPPSNAWFGGGMRRLDIDFSYPENLWKPDLHSFLRNSRETDVWCSQGGEGKKTADAVKQIWYPTIVIELLPGLTQQQSHRRIHLGLQ